jgi:hypothetical protein
MTDRRFPVRGRAVHAVLAVLAIMEVGGPGDIGRGDQRVRRVDEEQSLRERTRPLGCTSSRRERDAQAKITRLEQR